MEYNDLTYEQREACEKVILEFQIRDYKIEKQRLKKFYELHLKEVNAHMKNCEQALEKIIKSVK